MKSPRTKIGMTSTSKAVKCSFLAPGALGRGRGLSLRDLCSLSVPKQKTPIGDRSKHNAFAPQGTPSSNNNSFVLEEELMQEDISLHLADQAMQGSQRMEADQVMQYNQRVEDEQAEQNDRIVEVEQMMQDNQKSTEIGSSATKKFKKVRGKNKCKEVAALEPGEKLKVIFFNNRVVGKNHRLFSRHLGKLVRDSNMCPLAVESWRDIKQERLQHLWDAVVDKFESDDMDIHREHVFEWMKELWNRWRGNLHAKYVRDKPIQEALRKVPKGVDKKQWEWLVKNHFSTESFQETSKRNSANRAKLKMPHHIGSKPIREIIYQKGGKDGNPPDLATIFFETRKKNNKLVELETIEKHAQIQELVQSQPSLDSIDMVERCFGPQNRSHVVVFGGGVKAKDFKGSGSSKVGLLSELRSTREENKSLKDRLAAIESEVNEIKKLKEMFLSQQSHVQLPSSPSSRES